MRKTFLLSIALAGLVIAGLVACSSPSPTAKSSPAATSTTPTAKPSPTVTTSVSPSPKASPKPTTTTAPASGSFAGKTVTLVVTTAAGGSTDIVARVYAKLLSDLLEGKPTIVVRNIPGGASTIGANYVYQAKPDGMTGLLTSATLLLNQMLGVKAVQYDLLKMRAINAMSTSALTYMKSGIVSKPEDVLKAKGLIYGGVFGTGVLFICAKEALEIPFDKVILAYGGGADARRALLAGEVHVATESAPAYGQTLQPLIAKGDMMSLFQSGLFDDKGDLVKDPALDPATPTVGELYQKLYNKPPSGIAWDAFRAMLAGSLAYTNGLYLPPGTPDNIVKAYWDAAGKMVKSPEFLTAVAPLVGKDTRWMAGEAFEKGFRTNYSAKPETTKWVKDTLTTKYAVTID